VITSTSARIEERVRQLGADRATGVVGDLTEVGTATRLVETALERFGALHVVVHNAGMTSVTDPTQVNGAIESIEYAGWRSGIARNLDTAYLVARAALPELTGGGWGRFIMVSSVSGPVMAMRHEPVYATAKAGMVGLARALAVDVAPYGVTVTRGAGMDPDGFPDAPRGGPGRGDTAWAQRPTRRGGRGDCVARDSRRVLRDGTVPGRRRR